MAIACSLSVLATDATAGQTPSTPPPSPTAVASAAAATLKKAASETPPEAKAAATEAEKVAKLAVTVGTTTDALLTSTRKPDVATKEIQSAAAAAFKAAQSADSSTQAAITAAGKAAAVVKTTVGKAKASEAVTSAIVAAAAATTSLAEAKKVHDGLGEVADIETAKRQATTIAEHTSKIAGHAAAVAEGARVAADEALQGSLEVIGPRDATLLSAIRAQVTGGAIFFNGPARIVPNDAGTAATIQSTQFSQASTYLAFEAQPRLWAGNGQWCGKKCHEERAGVARERGYYRFYFDPFVSVRLTAIPVAGAKPEGAKAIEAPGVTVLQSQKAAQLQLGALLNWNFGGFSIKDTKFHWGLGPVARFGLQSVTDSQRTVRLWDLDNDLFKMPSAGMRLTLYEKDREVGGSIRDGWAPAAYLDVSLGRFENFEVATGLTEAATTCLKAPEACLARADGVPTRVEFQTDNDPRWYLEGRVYLQYLYLGFDLNTGRGNDDLRFIGGLTMKLDQFFSRKE